MNAQTNKKGFTIIEVVLVLAIAALIFLMIFIALPALQRGQRDTARKNDVGIIATAINNYRSNGTGKVDALTAETLDGYIDNLAQVEKGKDNITVGSGTGTAPTEVDKVNVFKKAKCKDNAAVADSSSRSAVVLTKLEQGGAYCRDA